MIKKLLFTILIAFASINLFSQGIFISEVADGTGSGGYPKYVEITNPTTAPFDLNGYKIRKCANGGALADAYVISSTQILPAGESIIITNMDNTSSGQLWTDFNLTAPTNVIHGASNINGNGDDTYAFTNSTDVIIDLYGEELIDGTGTVWEYLDSYAYRVSTVDTSNTTFTASEWYIAPINTLDNLSADLSPYLTPGTHLSAPSTSDAYILTFSFVEQTGPAVIDTANGTVSIEVLNGSTITALVPTITLSSGATINPNSGIPQDFTSPFSYVTTASNGTTTKTWTVTVIEAFASSAALIETFVLAEQTGPAITDTSLNTITIEVISGTAVTALSPTITISAGANINPLSGTAQDFTNVFTYTVYAQDSTARDWDVTVTVAVPLSLVSIYDIQGQTAVSPYDTLQVKTAGIITAISPSAFWIQDGAGAWNGLYVYDSQYISNITIGDSIIIEGTIEEYYDLTELKDISSLTIISSGNNLPSAEIILTSDADEAYESVLVEVLDAACINADAGYGMWVINNGANVSDSLLIDDDIFAYTPTLNDNYNIQGIFTFTYNDYKILPREANDIFLIIGIEQNDNIKFSVYPNPAMEEINLDNISNIDYVTLSSINGNEIRRINVVSENLKINTSCLKTGMYVISAFDKEGNISTIKFIKK